MIIGGETIMGYILNSDSCLEEILSEKTLGKLKGWEAKIRQPPLSIVDMSEIYHRSI